MFRCFRCSALKPTAQGLTSHIRLTAKCRRAFNEAMAKNAAKLHDELVEEPTDPQVDAPAFSIQGRDELQEPSTTSRSVTPDNGLEDPQDSYHAPSPPNALPSMSTQSPAPPEASHLHTDKRARVDEVPDEELEAGRLPKDPFAGHFPGLAGATYGEGKTFYDEYHALRVEEGLEGMPWAPFESEEEWELARWLLMSGLSQAEIDRYLKLHITRTRTQPSFKNKQSFLQKIDSLPHGPEWQCELIKVTGDKIDKNGKPQTEVVELWRRDPVECVRDLIGNPAFASCLEYAPRRLFEDAFGEHSMISEMWSADWWEEVQKILPDGVTIAPVILASDKTQLSHFSGDKSAWPVYLSIGNLAKATRRSPSSHGTILVGYLPVTKLECFSEKVRSLRGYQLFHESMRALLRPLANAGLEGVEMVCADGFIRIVHPILAAYMADHPEQCLVACCKENFCPKCTVKPERRGWGLHSLLRDPEKSAEAIAQTLDGRKSAIFSTTGLRPIRPFWDDLPHCNIFKCITPDILHQLHKGMFKEHVSKWATKLMQGQDAEVDRRFKAMTPHGDLRHFRTGISLITQWTGNEYKEMEKIFLGVVAGGIDEKAVIAVRSLLDFIYYARFEVHTDDSLANMAAAWKAFHLNKDVFKKPGVRTHFDFPKFHSMVHYIESIRALGTADGYNTEGPERLHIDFAKLGYRASNKKAYIMQMTRWLERREAVRKFETYLEWRKVPRTLVTEEDEDSSEEDEDEDYEDLGAEDDVESDTSDDGPEDESAAARNQTHAQTSTSPPLASPASQYLAAKTPPYVRVPLQDVVSRYCVDSFPDTLYNYMVDAVEATSPGSAPTVPPIDIHSLTRISVYKQVKLQLPVMSQVSQRPSFDTVRAVPSTPAAGRQRGSPSYFSTVLVATPPAPAKPTDDDESRAMNGLRVAQVRLIFRLPEAYRDLCGHPLAFIEWFTPFASYSTPTGMFSVTRSTRNHRQRVAIVPVTHFIRTCHLIPVYGQAMDESLALDNTLHPPGVRYFVNPYIRMSDFVIYRQVFDRARRPQIHRDR